MKFTVMKKHAIEYLSTRAHYRGALKTHTHIGGNCYTAEIDELLFAKRKKHCGRQSPPNGFRGAFAEKSGKYS